ncbi:MAG: NTP transferase domain-containing protein [bacterium]|nr:NTP transferase domain-containing protein [bacterium]
MPDPRFDVLVLAGRRDPNDELARAAGAPHRALLEIAGEPMLLRVLTTLERHPKTATLLLCSDSRDLVEAVPELANMIAERRVEWISAAPSPSRSVLAGIDALSQRDTGRPLLVTTADHALLDHEMLDFFFAAAMRSQADVLVGLVPETLLAARFPEARRTYLPLRGERYSGANLFAFMTPSARNVAVFWRRAEHDRKQPWKMVSRFGFVSLLLFVLRRLDLEAAFGRVSKSAGARVEAVEIPIAEAAVDVDKLSDWKLVNQILADRAVHESRN